MRLKTRQILVVALALALAWGIRGQHGHERGAAIAGAMAGLSLAAVTGGARWISAAVIGSLTFAIGGSLSYGRFVQLATQGSVEAILYLALTGFAWGGLGSLGLGLGLALPKYRPWERGAIAGGLFLVWFVIDRLLWGSINSPQEMDTRKLMAVILFGSWAFLCAYGGVWRQDRTSLKLGIAGAVGFGLGFPLAAWVQGIGSASGLPIDWWKISEHLIGLCGGIALGLSIRTLEPTWTMPLAVRPLERFLAFLWLLWFLPSWIMANNLDYWILERGLVPVEFAKIIRGGMILALLSLALWGWLEIRRGRTFVTSWMPRHLRALFKTFVWLATLIASSKTLAVGSFTPTPLLFIFLALLTTTWALRSE
ncbi:MAG: hypothetical protein HYZ90_06685 [Candidatus Omnitrophica bacterium]|nr:hypothetical protein [Candidatus Omnitrophota bacterium]